MWKENHNIFINIMEIGNHLLIVFQYVYLRRKTFAMVIVFLFLGWIMTSFMVCKWCKKNILDNVYVIDYSPKSRRNIELYGDLPIRNVYVVRESISNVVCLLLNILTFNNYSKQIHQYSKEIEDEYFFPKHTYIILDIEMPNKCIKKITIDKNPQLCISLRLKLWDNTELLKLNVKRRGITLRELLNDTKMRIGCDRFFNWNIYTNNCQYFTSELLSTLRLKKNRYIDFVDQEEFKKRFVVSGDFKLHVFNCFTNIYSFLCSCFVEI